jgi:hypothetical protein
MKKLLLLITLALFTGFAYSQSPLPLGKSQINFGVGLSGWGVPFYFGFDYSAHKDITVGGELSYRAYNENWKIVIAITTISLVYQQMSTIILTYPSDSTSMGFLCRAEPWIFRLELT